MMGKRSTEAQVTSGQPTETQSPLVLWISGWGARPEVWDGCQPGEWHNHAVSFDGVTEPAELQQRVREDIEALQPEIIVGWSMGGMLLLEWLAAQLELSQRGTQRRPLPKLVIIGSTLRFCSSLRTEGWPSRIVERMQAKLAGGADEVRRAFAQSLLAEAERERWGREIGPWFTRGAGMEPQELHVGLTYLLEQDLREAWQQKIAPTLESGNVQLLWVQGEADGICPLGAVPAGSTGWQRIVIRDGGHIPFLTRRGECLDLLRSFAHEA